ncbi:hypothetical protein [Haloglomus halophilum]|uniref:hypothetical protein n=1 Tax=Haloglomus halophilum TaxID=2962672 RepID=UPI0020C965B2|nr:hypothetical protein [Haloglomus halophilum]
MGTDDIYNQIEARRRDRDDLEAWWDDHHDDLTQDQYETLFEWIIDEPFAYFPLVVKLTLDTADTAAELAANLERLAPHINADLAWGDFYTAFGEYMQTNPDVAQELYTELPVDTADWTHPVIGPVIAGLPHDDATVELCRLLASHDQTKVEAGIRGLATAFEDTELPPQLIDTLKELADDPAFHTEVIRANTAVFTANPDLWALTIDIGRNNPTHIPRILQQYGRHIERAHLEEYLALAEHGMAEGTVDDVPVHFLYMDFSAATDQLADFAVTLSDTSLTSTTQLVDHVADENDAILPAVLARVDAFPTAFHAVETVFAAGKDDPARLVDLVIDRYDPSHRRVMLQLLQKAVGELFFATTYDRSTATSLADFLTTIDSPAFVRPIDDELIGQDPDDDEHHNKEVYYHLYNVLNDHIQNREYDQSTLTQLDDYPQLKRHFHTRLSRKIDQATYHPMLDLLQNDAETYLTFLEENWNRIPVAKQQQLLGDAFESTLSEIGFHLWLDNHGLVYRIDVPLHHHETDEELDKDVDVVVDNNYIEIKAPQLWRNLDVANKAIGIPNTAYNKIADKFKSDYTSTAELTEDHVFIALDITQSEIMPEQVVASLYGSLKIQLTYDTETGQAVDDRPVRDPDDALQGWPLLDDNLNGVIWYTAHIITDSDGTPDLQVDGDVIPNPHHQDGDNPRYCSDLADTLFSP